MNRKQAIEILNYNFRIKETKDKLLDFIDWLEYGGISLVWDNDTEVYNFENPTNLVDMYLLIDKDKLKLARQLIHGENSESD